MEVALAFVAEAVPVLAVDIWSLAVCAVSCQCAALTASRVCWSPSASVRRSARDASSVMAFTRCRWHGIHRGRGRCTSALSVVSILAGIHVSIRSLEFLVEEVTEILGRSPLREGVPTVLCGRYDVG